jgi:hypothetical protein
METYQDYEFMKDGMSYLYDWVFHYNHYNQVWSAVPRDKYTEYWDRHDHPDVLRSSQLATLLELLHKSRGDIDIIEEIIDND